MAKKKKKAADPKLSPLDQAAHTWSKAPNNSNLLKFIELVCEKFKEPKGDPA